MTLCVCVCYNALSLHCRAKWVSSSFTHINKQAHAVSPLRLFWNFIPHIVRMHRPPRAIIIHQTVVLAQGGAFPSPSHRSLLVAAAADVSSHWTLQRELRQVYHMELESYRKWDHSVFKLKLQLRVFLLMCLLRYIKYISKYVWICVLRVKAWLSSLDLDDW